MTVHPIVMLLGGESVVPTRPAGPTQTRVAAALG
jgi:hypothetical protein